MITLRKPAEILSAHTLPQNATTANRSILLRARLRLLWRAKKHIEILLAEFDSAIDRDEGRLSKNQSVLNSEASCSS